LVLAFQVIETNACVDEAAKEFVAGVRKACPYLSELATADANWTEFKLPVEH
jgi:hypothetical protein